MISIENNCIRMQIFSIRRKTEQRPEARSLKCKSRPRRMAETAFGTHERIRTSGLPLRSKLGRFPSSPSGCLTIPANPHGHWKNHRTVCYAVLPDNVLIQLVSNSRISHRISHNHIVEQINGDCECGSVLPILPHRRQSRKS